ncbi:MAG: hypothetical protein J1E63_07085 [Muribaculaceae bacterium]|nr:hypothetical protein [Muribaculaceae bacterium]
MKKFILTLAITLVAVLTVNAKKVTGYTTDNAINTPLALVVNAVDFRPDGTRVYGTLIGQPHTSNRIDEATLQVGNAVNAATDIDGVDFKRYFQWEDEGIIDVEIDFPALKKQPAQFIIKLTCPRGVSEVKVKKK